MVYLLEDETTRITWFSLNVSSLCATGLYSLAISICHSACVGPTPSDIQWPSGRSVNLTSSDIIWHRWCQMMSDDVRCLRYPPQVQGQTGDSTCTRAMGASSLHRREGWALRTGHPHFAAADGRPPAPDGGGEPHRWGIWDPAPPFCCGGWGCCFCCFFPPPKKKKNSFYSLKFEQNQLWKCDEASPCVTCGICGIRGKPWPCHQGGPWCVAEVQLSLCGCSGSQVPSGDHLRWCRRWGGSGTEAFVAADEGGQRRQRQGAVAWRRANFDVNLAAYHAYHGGYPRDVNRCCRFGEFWCVKWLIQTGHGVQTG